MTSAEACILTANGASSQRSCRRRLAPAGLPRARIKRTGALAVSLANRSRGVRLASAARGAETGGGELSNAGRQGIVPTSAAQPKAATRPV